MILEINKLINSENKYINKIGWLIYDRENQTGGLTKSELENLLELLTPINFEDIEYEQFEKGKQEGFNEGYSLGLEEGKVQATMITNKDKIKEVLSDLSAITYKRRGVFSEYD